MHLLVMVAERVRDAQFGNIHQSTLSIPGVAVKKKINKQLGRSQRRRSVPKSPHILMKCWSGVPGCCLPSLPCSTHTQSQKPVRQTPVCTGAAHSGVRTERQSGFSGEAESGLSVQMTRGNKHTGRRQNKGQGSDG